MSWLKRIGAGIGALGGLAGLGMAYLALRSPPMRPIDGTLKVQATPALIERGRYLVEAHARCLRCHSENDWRTHGGPPLAGGRGAGWDIPSAARMPGRVIAPNITSDVETGIGALPDDAIRRAVREGVGHDGRALFMMPWEDYRHLSDQEMAAIIAYLRTLPAIERRRETTAIRAPIRWFIKSKPRPLTEPVPEPDLSDPVARGKHLAEIGLCRKCHTPVDGRHEPLPGLAFAGGTEVEVGGLSRAANITPHASGIAHYSEALFIRTMRTGNIGGRRLHPLMPWYEIRKLSDPDLKALWAYLTSLPPIAHDVPRAPVDLKDNPEVDDRAALVVDVPAPSPPERR
jgi:mono/diheme cytochrome c family protein